jgi:hypothetical protein
VLHPVGPLPASVYWRRRVLAIAAALGVLLLAWVALPGGEGDGGSGGRQETSALVGSPSPTGAEPTSLAATPPAGDPGRAGDAGSGASGAGTATPATTTPSAPPPPPQPCTDSALSLRAVPERPAYRVGDTPVVDLVVRNVSAAACARDLGARQQEVVLYAGTRRLWSSNDCYPGGSRDVQVLQPGDSASFSVTWSGLSSRPRCAGERVRVTAGTYQLVARLDTLASARAPLVLR